MLDQITHLFRLRTILEEGSLRRASEKLNLTQPALSRSLAQLEAHFGQQLVERHARGVVATAFGERVLAVSTRIERYWDIAEHELTAGTTENKMRMRIGAGPLWRSGILSPVFVEMQRRFPWLIFELVPLTYGGTITDLREGRLDVAFSGVMGGVAGEISDDRLVRHKLTEITNEVMVREGHPIFGNVDRYGTIRPAALLDYPWIVYSEWPIYGEITQHMIYERLGKDADVRMLCQNLLTTLTMLQQSDNLCLLPEFAVISAQAPRIVPLPVTVHPRRADVGIVHREELSQWEPIQTLVELSHNVFTAKGLETAGAA
ncbi:LysR family transcriptional regulator [Pelagibacterium halotolerans]|uniref:Transcriptional regulator n=1 Tax=Pelagibacterium halotolerans (strain DSM 22347 / JCM 15775 / CGMCC 1.7692 / B2) TaxID=1082931 RepID=G4R7D0_PELHB|nr:LysR family transcriptional regulator [Pelagibacterium halotolerans]AEQ51266.1 transcriptional regulator [Pelagibacterium halotolerans B2]QJR18877.1 LysR family transcriptional regulator [Pelagibacterium halotolerans]SEA66896.1 DNA-binding transcriptional regulator, LysR family [Pelagibacterium halotolerans]